MTRTERRRGRYGAAHQRARLDYLSHYRPGITPCARCGEPMDEDPALLDLDHSDDGPGYLGLSHRTCNRTYGRRIVPRGRNQRAPRVCERCFTTYQPSHCDQRWCSRACAVAAKRAAAESRPKQPKRIRPKPRRTSECAICGGPADGLMYCGDECRVEKNRRVNRDLYRARVGLPVDASQPSSKWLESRQREPVSSVGA